MTLPQLKWTIVLYGCNPAWASAGLPSYNLIHAQKAGAKFIYVGPSYNETSNLVDAKWIQVRPGWQNILPLI